MRLAVARVSTKQQQRQRAFAYRPRSTLSMTTRGAALRRHGDPGQGRRRAPARAGDRVHPLLRRARCVRASRRRGVRMRAHNWRGLFWRGAFGGAAVLCYFLAIEHLTVGMATLLNYTAPVFTALWAWLFLGERIALGTLGALAITTAGVGVVIVGRRAAGRRRARAVAAAWGSLSSVLSGAAVATIREVRKTDGSWEIFAAFCVAGALFTGVPACAAGSRRRREWLHARRRGHHQRRGAADDDATRCAICRAAAAGVLFQLTPVSTIVLGRFFYGERPMRARDRGRGGHARRAWRGARISRRRRGACSRCRRRSRERASVARALASRSRVAGERLRGRRFARTTTPFPAVDAARGAVDAEPRAAHAGQPAHRRRRRARHRPRAGARRARPAARASPRATASGRRRGSMLGSPGAPPLRFAGDRLSPTAR